MARNPAPPSAAPSAARFYDGRRYVVADSVGYLMHLVFGSMRRQVAAGMAAHGLTAAQWYPLWKLERDGPGTAQDMARDMDMDAGAVTRLIDRLAAKGLVERTRSSIDRRVVMLSLSTAGKAVAAKVPHVLAEVNNANLQGFSQADWNRLKQLLRRMLANGQKIGQTGAQTNPPKGQALPAAAPATPAKKASRGAAPSAPTKKAPRRAAAARAGARR